MAILSLMQKLKFFFENISIHCRFEFDADWSKNEHILAILSKIAEKYIRSYNEIWGDVGDVGYQVTVPIALP